MADDSCDVPFPDPEGSDNEHDFDSDDSNDPIPPTAGGATRNLFSTTGGEPHPHTNTPPPSTSAVQLSWAEPDRP